MQFTKAYKQAIAAGELTTTFRCWRAPQARVGGQYNIPPHGAIEVTRIIQQPLRKASKAALQRAGLADRDALEAFLGVSAETEIYQIDFKFLGAAHVKQPDTSPLDRAGLTSMAGRLTRMDAAQPWTRLALALIAEHPGTRAGDLAGRCGMTTPAFKRNIRKLKTLGLTESLDTGYRLSKRGQQLLAYLRQ